MILSNIKANNKVLIRLFGCGGWPAPLLFANPENRLSCIKAERIADLVEMCENSLNAEYFFMLLLSSADFFFKINFQKSFRSTIRLV